MRERQKKFARSSKKIHSRSTASAFTHLPRAKLVPLRHTRVSDFHGPDPSSSSTWGVTKKQCKALAPEAPYSVRRLAPRAWSYTTQCPPELPERPTRNTVDRAFRAPLKLECERCMHVVATTST